MRERLEQRLTQLREEQAAGERMLTELEAKQAHLRSTLLRISGAVQVLEELLIEEPGRNGAASVTTAPTEAVAIGVE